MAPAEPEARRVGSKTSKTRARLLDTAIAIMLEEGYAAVTSRGVAIRAGVQAPLVHYYFPSLDDLFIAAFRRGAEQNLLRLEALLAAKDPLRGLWRYANERSGVALTFEFLALSNHRKALQSEIASAFVKFRELELQVVTAAMTEAGVDLKRNPPEGLLQLIITAPAGLLQQEQLLGVTGGHDAALKMLERMIAQSVGVSLDPKARKQAPTRKAPARGTASRVS